MSVVAVKNANSWKRIFQLLVDCDCSAVVPLLHFDCCAVLHCYAAARLPTIPGEMERYLRIKGAVAWTMDNISCCLSDIRPSL